MFVEREHRISRRTFGKSLAALGLAIVSPEIVSRGYTAKVTHERSEIQPALLPVIPQHSVAYGLAPDQNRLEHLFYTSERVQATPQIVNFFISSYGEGEKNAFAFSQIEQAASLGMITMVSWGTVEDLFGENVVSRRRLPELARRLAAYGVHSFRPVYEFNTPWGKSWYGSPTPEQFRIGWQHLRTIFHEAGAPDIKFVFSPNATNMISISPFEEYFPGNEFIDFVSLDVYNKYSYNLLKFYEHYFVPNLTPEVALGPDIVSIQKLTKKPWMLTEVNATVEHGRSQWIVDAMAFAVRAGAVACMTYDWDRSHDEGFDFRTSQDPLVARRIQEELQKEYYIARSPNIPAHPQQVMEILLSRTE